MSPSSRPAVPALEKQLPNGRKQSERHLGALIVKPSRMLPSHSSALSVLLACPPSIQITAAQVSVSSSESQFSHRAPVVLPSKLPALRGVGKGWGGRAGGSDVGRRAQVRVAMEGRGILSMARALSLLIHPLSYLGIINQASVSKNEPLHLSSVQPRLSLDTFVH